MEGHAKPVLEEEQPAAEADFARAETDASEADDVEAELGPQSAPLPLEEREVTAILVRTDVFSEMTMANEINEGRTAQSVKPIRVIYELLDQIVAPIQWLLLAITTMICFVSGLSILVSIYNSMSDRRHEIAVMRALGAGRRAVMGIVLLESIILSVGGGLLGWLFGHALITAAGRAIEDRTGVAISLFDFAPPMNLALVLGGDPAKYPAISSELLLIPFLIVLAVAVGFWPALSAYRTDVAKSL